MEAELIQFSEQDKKVQELSTRARGLIERANAIEVIDDETDLFAKETVIVIRKVRKQWKELRDFVVKPIKALANDQDSRFKQWTEPVETAEKALDAKILTYNTVKEAESAKELEKQIKAAAKLQEKADQKAAENGEIAAPVAVQMPVTVETHTKTSAGSYTIKKSWKAHLIPGQEHLVPRDLLTIDMVLVNKRVNSGVHEIPGFIVALEPDSAVR